MFKIDMLFQQQTNKNNSTSTGVRVAGWSEGFYIDVTEPNARIALDTLCQRRAGLLTNAGAIVGQRVRQVGGGSSSGQKNFPGTVDQLADIPNMALKVAAGGVNVANVRHWDMPGLADARVIEGAYQPSSAATFAFNTFKNVVGALQLRFKCQDLAATKGQVVSVDAAGNIVFATPVVFSMGDEVSAVRVRDPLGSAVPGRFIIIGVTDTTHYKIAGWPAVVGHGGDFRKVVTIYPLIDSNNMYIVDVAARKVGRVFRPYRGRRSTRR